MSNAQALAFICRHSIMFNRILRLDFNIVSEYRFVFALKAHERIHTSFLQQHMAATLKKKKAQVLPFLILTSSLSHYKVIILML